MPSVPWAAIATHSGVVDQPTRPFACVCHRWTNARNRALPITKHPTRQVNTVFAADAVARISGVPGVAAVTAGPGVTNTVTAIKNAQMAQSPVVLLGGAAATLLKGKGSLQDIDQMAVLSPIVKYAVACTTVREIVPALRKAFQEASSGVPGPVYVELPLDILYNVKEFRSGAGLSASKKKRDLELPGDYSKIVLPVEFQTKEGKGGRKDVEK